VEQQVVSIWAGTNGHLDDVAVSDVRRFEAELLDFVGRSHPEIYAAIVQTGKLGDDVVSGLTGAIGQFKQQFTTGEGKSLVGNEAPAEAMDAEDRGQEKITRYAKPSSVKR
jgi:F-type H+-transporting ATPase subunit alpha